MGIEDVVNITNIWRSGDIDVVELKKDLVKSTKVRRNWQLHPRIWKRNLLPLHFHVHP